MQKRYVMSKNIINHYSRLPNSQTIKKFIEKLQQKKKEKQKSIIRYCFLVVFSLQDAFLTACFCFGGLNFIEKLSKVINQQETVDYFRNQVMEYADDVYSAYHIFQNNARLFGQSYPFYYQNVLQKIQKEKAQQFFRQVVNQQVLHGVKIRLLNFNSQKRKTQYARENQKSELKVKNGKWHFIIAKVNDQEYNIGIVEQKPDISIEKSFISRSQSHYQSFSIENSKYGESIEKDLYSKPKSFIQYNQKATKQKGIQKQYKDVSCCKII